MKDTGKFRIELDGEKLTQTVSVPKTGGETQWELIPVETVQLKAGNHLMRIYIESGGFNLDYIEFNSGRDIPKAS